MFVDKKNQYCYDVNSFHYDYRLDRISVKISTSYFVETNKLNLEFI